MKRELILLLVGTGVVSFVLSYVGSAAGLILGHLRLPLLVYALGNPIAGASTNLAVSGAGAVAGSYKHFRDRRSLGQGPAPHGRAIDRGRGHRRAVLRLGQSGLVARGDRRDAARLGSGAGPGGTREEGQCAGRRTSRWQMPGEIAIGLALGVLAATTGLMLGTMRLPMMIRFLHIDPGVAVGSNMVIGCLTAATAAATAWAAGGGLDPLSVAIVGPPTILGSYLGARKTGKLSPHSLKRMVGWVVAASGVFMIALAVPSIIRRPEETAPSVREPAPIEDLPDLRPKAPRPPRGSRPGR